MVWPLSLLLLIYKHPTVLTVAQYYDAIFSAEALPSPMTLAFAKLTQSQPMQQILLKIMSEDRHQSFGVQMQGVSTP